MFSSANVPKNNLVKGLGCCALFAVGFMMATTSTSSKSKSEITNPELLSKLQSLKSLTHDMASLVELKEDDGYTTPTAQECQDTFDSYKEYHGTWVGDVTYMCCSYDEYDKYLMMAARFENYSGEDELPGCPDGFTDMGNFHTCCPELARCPDDADDCVIEHLVYEGGDEDDWIYDDDGEDRR